MFSLRRFVGSDFLMSTELELQTSVGRGAEPFEKGVERFFEVLRSVAPSVPGPSGLFNAYGRIYFDCGHIELAMCECASPWELASIVERQQSVVRTAVRRCEQDGFPLLLANNNSDGLLTSDAPTWGSHENILTERHPERFAQWILPFLVTRLHAGSGGIDLSAGTFVAGVRALHMQTTVGGGTTERRAIHSTAREEHHLGDNPRQFRYHLILGDGHRSHYNLALQFATTALALKAIFFVRGARRRITRISEQFPGLPSVMTLQRFNVLERSGVSWSVHPTVTEIQRVYLELATQYAERLSKPPEWIGWALDQWARMLDALDNRDLDWLSMRLDAFAKYRVYSAILASRAKTWSDLRQDLVLANELALLDQSYHAFCQSDSLFERLERAGLMQHRLTPYVAPGSEPDPWIPNTGTRADARARKIRDYAAENRPTVMDWSCVYDRSVGVIHTLLEPFATEYTLSSELPSDVLIT